MPRLSSFRHHRQVQLSRHRSVTSLLAAAALMLPLTAAHADAIDGDWCFETQNLNISGPKLRLPSGQEIVGDYDRHGFRYTAQPSEPNPGTAVSLQLFHDDLMRLVREGREPELWRRCKPVS